MKIRRKDNVSDVKKNKLDKFKDDDRFAEKIKQHLFCKFSKYSSKTSSH